MWQLLPPAALLLLVSAGMQADLPKSVVLLDPPYDRVLTFDNVILKCQGKDPFGNSSTEWLHNGKPISAKSSSYFFTVDSVNDGGEYRCRDDFSSFSDPVHLTVRTGSLLLQSLQWVFQVGEPIQLRCHTWKNKTVTRLSYLRNGVVKKFSHNYFDFYIPEAKQEHNGSYFCRGIVAGNNVSSETVHIFVQEGRHYSNGTGEAIPSTRTDFISWQITIFLVVGFLFAVDTGLYFFVWRDLRSSVEIRRDINVRAKTLMTYDP
ncbi:low affinity immunoglobulin gamma Fc region receptor III-B-like isoform X2 [Talpa occidentalis]|uniref:low affinity immunoglobulin gamma Fc region receptor III-B-like isoform X2 n=1 Tax=Talpa occidentalis TaxID=50954 RepID=UPI00188E56D7|nr:low affinity immunoglobulin gamma Fc region receptor III-B-like isoform X2 [Talpa occidentalis]